MSVLASSFPTHKPHDGQEPSHVVVNTRHAHGTAHKEAVMEIIGTSSVRNAQHRAKWLNGSGNVLPFAIDRLFAWECSVPWCAAAAREESPISSSPAFTYRTFSLAFFLCFECCVL